MTATKKALKIGDKVKSKWGYSKKIGTIVYIHPIDVVKYVVDYGDEWYGEIAEDIELAEVELKGNE